MVVKTKLKTIVMSVGVSLLFYCLGCGSGLIGPTAGLIPSISQVLPQSIPAGSQAVTMKVMGTNFSNSTVILWNGAALTTSMVDSSTLSAPVQGSNISNPGTAELRVQNPQTREQSSPVAVAILSSGATAALGVATTSLPAATVGSAYSATLLASGGTAPYTWSLTSGSLPAGLSLSTAGVISGMPTVSGSFPFEVTARGSGLVTQTAHTSLTLNVAAAPVPALTITTMSLPSGTSGSPYSASLQATGGTAPYTWSISSGNLPSGLSLTTSGAISGSPSASGTATIGVTVRDSGSLSAQTTLSFSITAPKLNITSLTLPSGTAQTAYTASLQATGGTGPYTWSIASGSLPSGLSLSTAGVLSGTPTANGTYSLGIKVSDSAGQVAQSTLSFSIAAASATPLSITTTTLPSGTSGSAYTVSVQASGGTAPYTWSVISGNLPSGLTLSTAGVLSGTPTTSGSYSLLIKVRDSALIAQSATTTLTLSVAAQPSGLTITTASLPSGTSAAAYSTTLQASGGTAPYTWSITSGSLPTGLTLSSAGVLSGTPTASGSFTVTIKVRDSALVAKTATTTLTFSIGSQLVITTTTLPAGTTGSAYSTTLQATGGSGGYTWTISNLPTGLTLGATTGTITGTSTATGSVTLNVTVTDSSAVAQTATSQLTLNLSSPAPVGPGTTWYIRADGGTRYSTNNPQGQCDGKSDAAYSGKKTNQHCAFNDIRYLWDDQSWQNSQWVISGGDTVILRGGPWRIGIDDANNALGSNGKKWCFGWDSSPYGCYNPTIPSGTATQHTRILGENYGSCGSKSAMTQLYGGYGTHTTLNMDGAQYVDVQCIELTRHSDCTAHGVPSKPSYCNRTFPLDDYADEGIIEDVNTHDLLLQDMWIHGFTDRGIIGPIGGTITANRVDISTNGMAGWDFDDGNATPSVNGQWNFLNSTIEWSGCNQQYPAVDPIPLTYCYSQSTGGYGDGVGTPAGTGFSVKIDHSNFLYNTQDGLDLGHVDTGNWTLSITNSVAYGNNGGTFKWGPNFLQATMTDSLVLANCMRMSAPMAGAPSTYNQYLADYCRAGDGVSFDFRHNGTLLFANNSVVNYAPTTFDIQCWDQAGSGSPNQGVDGFSDCSAATMTFENNIVLAYSNPAFDYGGNGGPGLFYLRDPIGTIVRSNNLYRNIGHGFTCPTGYPGEICLDPQFVNEPIFTSEASLDNFNFDLAPSSPAKNAGIVIPILTTDFLGQLWSIIPSIGAY